jgi:hypothetical protein
VVPINVEDGNNLLSIKIVFEALNIMEKYNGKNTHYTYIKLHVRMFDCLFVTIYFA